MELDGVDVLKSRRRRLRKNCGVDGGCRLARGEARRRGVGRLDNVRQNLCRSRIELEAEEGRICRKRVENGKERMASKQKMKVQTTTR